MTVHLHILKGCSPAPLANYLKALGVLRLVGEQADKRARGWWDGEQYRLLTTLSQAELEEFFLERYEPTPLLSPWNKGCGFFKPDDPGLAPLEKSIAQRFRRFRTGVIEARKLIKKIARADTAIRAIKARTKTTAKAFQSRRQRKVLEHCDIYRSCLDQLQRELSKPDLAADKRSEIECDISTIKSLAVTVDKPPQRVDAEALKASTGYKRVLAAAERRFKSIKGTLIPDCRRSWRGPHADWLSAAVVLDEGGSPEWPSLLGTGGNDGNLDFTNNFMQQLAAVFDLDSETGRTTIVAKELLENSLWMEPVNKLTSAAIGQYQPGSAGGANSSTGFASGNLVNPWDFVLMMEGSLLFTSRATRRFDPNALSGASAPFAARPHAAGFATPGSEKAQRGEQWMPLWNQPATLGELIAMYGEARVQLDRRTANRPVDMARAISRLGVARGIDEFVRYAYLERNGQSTLAVPLGRVHVRQRPRGYLIDDLAGWMDQLQRHSRDKHAPARLVQAERCLADAVFSALTHDNTPDHWRAILDAAVAIESLQATGTAIEVGPIPALRPDWVAAVDDGSCEVRLALALGSAAADYIKGRPVDPVRHHCIPLEQGARRFMTADKRLVNDPRVVMAGRDATRDLSALVERRLIEAGMKGQRRSGLVAAYGCGAQLDDLAQFLSGLLDLRKLLGLARAFMAIRWGEWKVAHCLRAGPLAEPPDETWLGLRLNCLPWPLTRDTDIPTDPRLVRLLSSAQASRAIEIACTRLRSVGIRPPFQVGVRDTTSVDLWAAALAFPIDRGTALRAAAILDPTMKGANRA